MPTDDQLAAADLSGGAIRVALAHRAMVARGEAPTVEKIMVATGLGKTAVYEGRKALRRAFGAEYQPPDQAVSANPNGDSASAEPPKRALVPRLRRPDVVAPAPNGDLVPAYPEDPDPRPIWRVKLEDTLVILADRGPLRSWDLWKDLYEPTWDLICLTVPPDQDPTPQCIGLAAHYVASVLGPDGDDGGMTGEDRRLVAMLVRQYGKAGLYGITRALGVTESPGGRSWYPYARRVAERIVAEIREETPV